MYSTRARVNARIPNGHPRKESARPDFRARRTRRLPREDHRTEVGEEVRVGVDVRVGPVEFSYNGRAFARDPKGRRFESRSVRFHVTALSKRSPACASLTKQYNLVPAYGW